MCGMLASELNAATEASRRRRKNNMHTDMKKWEKERMKYYMDKWILYE